MDFLSDEDDEDLEKLRQVALKSLKDRVAGPNCVKPSCLEPPRDVNTAVVQNIQKPTTSKILSNKKANDEKSEISNTKNDDTKMNVVRSNSLERLFEEINYEINETPDADRKFNFGKSIRKDEADGSTDDPTFLDNFLNDDNVNTNSDKKETDKKSISQVIELSALSIQPQSSHIAPSVSCDTTQLSLVSQDLISRSSSSRPRSRKSSPRELSPKRVFTRPISPKDSLHRRPLSPRSPTGQSPRRSQGSRDFSRGSLRETSPRAQRSRSPYNYNSPLSLSPALVSPKFSGSNWSPERCSQSYRSPGRQRWSPHRRFTPPPHKKILPDLLNVQLSPRSLAFVSQNAGIILKRRDRRSVSRSTEYDSSTSRSSGRRSISPWSKRPYFRRSPSPKRTSISPSYRHSKPSPPRRVFRVSRTPPNRPRSRSPVRCRPQQHKRPELRRGHREVSDKRSYKSSRKECSKSRKRSMSLSLSPSPERGNVKVTMPINRQNNRFNVKRDNERHSNFLSNRANSKENTSEKCISDQKELNKRSIHQTCKSPDSLKGQQKKVLKIDTDKADPSPMTESASIQAPVTIDNTNIETQNIEKIPIIPQNLDVKNEVINKSEDIIPENEEFEIDLDLNPGHDDLWSSEDTDCESSGRFKLTSNTESVTVSRNPKNDQGKLDLSLDDIFVDMSRPSSKSRHFSRREEPRRNQYGVNHKFKNRPNRVIKVDSKQHYIEKSNTSTTPPPKKLEKVITLPKKNSSEDANEKNVTASKKSTPESESEKPKRARITLYDTKKVNEEENKGESKRANKIQIAPTNPNETVTTASAYRLTSAEGDLRDQLRDRRVRSKPVVTGESTSRIVQSAFQGVVSTTVRLGSRTETIQASSKDISEGFVAKKSKFLSETRRVKWMERDPCEIDVPSVESSRVPVHLRLGNADTGTTSSDLASSTLASIRRRKNRGRKIRSNRSEKV